MKLKDFSCLTKTQSVIYTKAFLFVYLLVSTELAIIRGLTDGRWLHRKEQTFCGLKGLVLDDKPVTSGSCSAFCRQNN